MGWSQAEAIFPDGQYQADSFSYSGGTGRVNISLREIIISEGEAYAVIAFDSPNYVYVKVDGVEYEGIHSEEESVFQIPIRLNQENPIIGMSTAMSMEHEIAYSLYIELTLQEKEADGRVAADLPTVDGLMPISEEELSEAKLVRLFRYENGCAVVSVEGAENYLLVPNGVHVSSAVFNEMKVIQTPVKAVYIAQKELYELLDLMDDSASTSRVELLGFAEDSASGIFAGDVTSPDYAMLLKEECDVFLAPYDPGELQTQLSSRLDLLKIPLFLDRSQEEHSDSARLEWLKIYGILFGCEAKASAAYERLVETCVD